MFTGAAGISTQIIERDFDGKSEKLTFRTQGDLTRFYWGARMELPRQTWRMPMSNALSYVKCRVERETDSENYKDETSVGSEEQNGISCPSLSELAFWMEIDLPSPRDVGDYVFRNQTGTDKFETFNNMKDRKPLSDARNHVKLYCTSVESCQRIVSPKYPPSPSSDDDASGFYIDVQRSLRTDLHRSKSSGGGCDRPGCTPVAGYLPHFAVLTRT